jgi:hypothetical protein
VGSRRFGRRRKASEADERLAHGDIKRSVPQLGTVELKGNAPQITHFQHFSKKCDEGRAEIHQRPGEAPDRQFRHTRNALELPRRVRRLAPANRRRNEPCRTLSA